MGKARTNREEYMFGAPPPGVVPVSSELVEPLSSELVEPLSVGLVAVEGIRSACRR